MPTNYFDQKTNVIKLTPNQEGIFRKKNEIQSTFKINADGWNSKYPKYELEVTSKTRIAIIGDSYVEALQVDYNNSMAEQLENMLGTQHEVYRFGISGAPLSQYLHMLQKEVLAYKPQIVVFVLVHNDFDESWAYKRGRYTSSFLKFGIQEQTVTQELEPQSYEQSWYSPIRMSATFRYLQYRQGVNVSVLKKWILGNKTKYEANIDTTNLSQKMANNTAVVRYFLSQVSKLSQQHQFEPIVVIDGDRHHIYQNKSPIRKGSIFEINDIVGSLSQEKNIKFRDLHIPFEQDFKVNKKKFNSIVDSHWNEYGHTIVAKELHHLILHNP